MYGSRMFCLMILLCGTVCFGDTVSELAAELRPGTGRRVVEAPMMQAVGSDVWVIGESNPNESVVLTSDTVVARDITLINNGSLEVRGARLDLSGNIVMFGSSRFALTSATLHVQQAYSYEYDLTALESASIEWSDSALITDGSWSWGLTHDAQVHFRNIDSAEGFITWAAFENAAIEIDQMIRGGEFLAMGENAITLNAVDWVLYWITLPPGSLLDAELPDGASVNDWSLTSATAPGIGYQARISSSTEVLWGIMAEEGSTATLRNSDLRTVGTIWETTRTVIIEGVANGAHHEDTRYAWGTVNYRFINTRVNTYSFYPFGYTSLTLQRCIFGEVLAEDQAHVTLEVCTCDGTGGYIGAMGESVLLMVNSLNISQTTTKEAALFLAVNSTLGSRFIDSTGDSIMVFFNTRYAGDPEAHDRSAIFDARIEPVEGAAGAVLPVRGAARVITGPDSVISADYYEVEYASSASAAIWHATDGPQARRVREGELAEWDTSGLEPGTYAVRLTINNNLSPEVRVTNEAILRDEVVPAEPVDAGLADWQRYE